MDDDTETIEVDREELKEFFHRRLQLFLDFYPPDEYANEMADRDEFDSYDGALMFADGNLTAESDYTNQLAKVLDVEPQELAREYAEEHGYDTFEKPPFSKEERTP